MNLKINQLGKKNFSFGSIIKFIFIIILIFFAVRHINFNKIFSHLNINIFLSALLIQPLVLLSSFLMGLRLCLILRLMPRKILVTWKATVLATGLSVFFPVRSWELFKPVYLKKNLGLIIPKGLAAVFVERLSEIITLVLICLVGTLFFSIKREILIIALLLLIFLSIYVCCCYRKIPLSVVSILPGVKLREFLKTVINFIADSITQPDFYMVLSLSLLIWLSSIVSFIVFFKAFLLLQINILQIFVLFVLTTLGCAIPLLPGALGTYEAIVTLMLMQYGISAEQSFVIAIVLHFSQIIFITFGALIILAKENIGFSVMLKQVHKQTVR